jgi:hypothetical protein
MTGRALALLALSSSLFSACAGAGEFVSPSVVVSGRYTGSQTIIPRAGRAETVLIDCTFNQMGGTLDGICAAVGSLLVLGAPGTGHWTGRISGTSFTGQDLSSPGSCIIRGEFSGGGVTFFGRATCPSGLIYTVSLLKS